MIGILHSGDLKTVSLGGVSEYVRQFISNSDESTHLFGVRNALSSVETFPAADDFTPVCTDKRRPLTVWYVLGLLLLMVTRRSHLKRMNVFYAQRMEFVLPFIFLLRRTPVAFAIHGSGAYSEQFWGAFKAKVYHRIERIAISRASAVFVLNSHPEFGVNYYVKKYPDLSSRFHYARVPVQNDVFVAAGEAAADEKERRQKRTVLYYGRLEHNPKRVMLLPDILLQTRALCANVRMAVVGDGADGDRLRQRFEDLAVSEHVDFVPYLTDREQLARVVAMADVSLVISTFEGICMAALESLSAGVPVVGTRVGELPHYIESGKNGYIVSADSDDEIVKSVADAISKTIDNPDIHASRIPQYDGNIVIQETVMSLLKLVE